MLNEGPQPEIPAFPTMTAAEVLAALDSGPEGLNEAEAAARLLRYGPNQMAPVRPVSPLRIFCQQFANLLVLVLIAATVISGLMGETLDAGVILVILFACVTLGFIQEYRAEKAAQALARLAAPTAVVIREGAEKIIPAREVVPGDLLLLHAGDRVPADARLLWAANLMTDEALLTGESTPVAKNSAPLTASHLPVPDQSNMVFGGTVVTYGRGQAVVTATGPSSQFGRIARILGEPRVESTPLEKRLAVIGRGLSFICLSVAGLAVLLGLYQGNDLWDMLLWGLSLAVAAVPEALPAVVTGALAIGTSRMARRRAIVKRLPAVETMGCTTVICTDKTGTLTKNEMTVRRLYLDDRRVKVTGAGYHPEGEFLGEDLVPLAKDHPVWQWLLKVAVLCNDAVLEQKGDLWQVRGDPTEAALLVMARKAGLDPETLIKEYPRVAEIPFTSERKRMSTVNQGPGGLFLCIKGAPENLLPWCSKILKSRGEEPLDASGREAIAREAGIMATQALRPLGLAYRPLATIPPLVPESEEKDLIWLGLAGLMDPPRPEAREAVRRCREAGIRVIMVTGDHPDTAQAIAQELGLLPSGARSAVLCGPELNHLSDLELLAALREVSVVARVSPEHKLRLVQLLKSQGEVVAMTGDGVNDAPALKMADIGVAMGLTGTEVTKETADIILADDNFATLVAAVEEGRAIFDNIKKYLIYLLSCNLSEILVLTGAVFLGLPLPLLALQILWVNLTTDGLPALALGVDPKAPDIMARPPRPPGEKVFSRSLVVLVIVISLYLGLALLALFACYVLFDPHRLGDPGLILRQARTMVFATLIMAELVNAFNCRSELHSLKTVGLCRNPWLVLSVLLSGACMVVVIQWPPLAALFHTGSLTWEDWLLAAALSLGLIPVVETAKWRLRRPQLL